MRIRRDETAGPASAAVRMIVSIAALLPVVASASLVTLSAPPASATVSCPVVSSGVVTPAPTPGVDWSGCNLSGADFTGADLANADLSTTDLVRAIFSGTTLTGVNLTGATLRGVSSGGIIGKPSALPTHWLLRHTYLIGPGANLTDANLANGNLTDADLAGAGLVGTNLTHTDLTGATLVYVYSQGIIGTPSALPTRWRLTDGYLIGPHAVPAGHPDLSGVDLSGADLAYAQLNNADLTGADLTGADLTGAYLGSDNLTDADLTGADLGGSSLIGTTVTGANFTGTNLTGLYSGGVTGTPAVLPTGWVIVDEFLIGPGANLDGQDLSGIDLAGADLTGATLRSADLSAADLRGTNLTETDLSSGLADTDLTGADLAGADLTGANLDNAVLTGTDLTGANHHGTTVTGASWSGTTCPNATNSNSYVDGCFTQFLTGYTIAVDGATSASSHYGSPDTLAASGLLSGMTGSVLFYTAGQQLLCTATLPTASCQTSGTALPPGSYPGITASYTDNLGLRTWPSANPVSLTMGLRATSSVRCATEVGQGSTTVFRSCTPASAINGSTTGPGPLLGTGGTFTWGSSGRTSVLSVISTNLGKDQCPTGYTEYSSTGDVSGGTSTYTELYDPVSVYECQNNATKVTRLLAGTTASL